MLAGIQAGTFWLGPHPMRLRNKLNNYLNVFKKQNHKPSVLNRDDETNRWGFTTMIQLA